MDISPNPYRGKTTALADEHTDVLLAACSNNTFLAVLLSFCFPRLGAKKNTSFPEYHDWEEGWIVGPWRWSTRHQKTIIKGGYERDKDKVVDIVDLAIDAERDIIAPAPRPYGFDMLPVTEECRLYVLGDAGLPSIAKTLRRIEAVRSCRNAEFAVITRRLGLALQPLYDAEVIVIHPESDGGMVEELPRHWVVEIAEHEQNITLDATGFVWQGSRPFPTVSKEAFAAALEEAEVKAPPRPKHY